MFKAEDSFRLNNNSHVHERRFEYQNVRELEMMKWTGNGFMKVYDGGKLRFNLNHSYHTGLYDIVLRYEPNVYDWQDVSIRIKDLGGKSNFIAQRGKACSDFTQDQKEMEEMSIRIHNGNNSLK